MSALYRMEYMGVPGTGAARLGFGVLHIGRNRILGMDVAGIQYRGVYSDEAGGWLNAAVTLAAPPGTTGGMLVTGQQLRPGEALQIFANWPSDFASGQPRNVEVGGARVQVVLEKIGDVP